MPVSPPNGSGPPPIRNWHAIPIDEVRAAWGSDVTGLSGAEAATRLVEYGANRLPVPATVPVWRILLAQFASLIVLLLVVAVGIAVSLGQLVEAGAIAAVLVINTLIGFLTELRARQAIAALLAFDSPLATVLREGQLQVIDAAALVPGDVIDIEAGRQVPADARLVHAVDLRTNEAALTGESLPDEKQPDAVLAASTPLADRVTMVYKGTIVETGHGRAIVTATGSRTEVGAIGTLVTGVKVEPTPLERRMDALGRRLVWITLGIAAVVALLGLFHGLPVDIVVQTALALAIAAVPEALPTVATIALAVGVHRMARRHALVRRLPAVEALGSTTVVCTDKTRTLTSGDMTVVRVSSAGVEVTVDREQAWPPAEREAVGAVLEAALLASRTQAAGHGAHRDPVDVAVAVAATGAGIDAAALLGGRPRIGMVPFSSERKRLVTFHQDGPGIQAYMKGAPRAVLEACGQSATASGPRDLDQAVRDDLLATNDRLAGEGLRVLAVAQGPVGAAVESELHDLLFLGFLGLADPPAPGVKDTVGQLRDAGLRTVMLTGDQRLTAEAVGRALGLLDADDRAMDGRELDGLTPEQLGVAITKYNAFTRITPEHKLRIVRGLQAQGEVVAMLGDGVNDAAALKQANVGVAMGGRGTDVARQAAAIVLQDDQFRTIAAAVEEGRVIFDNIRKFVFYLFSCNVAEILVLVVASLAGLPLPLVPLQLLWLNLLTDTFPALALAVEPAGPGVMRRPPRRPDEQILSRRFVGEIVFYAGLITLSTLLAFVWALETAPGRAQTVAFMTLALAQVFHLGNARSSFSLLRMKHVLSNPYALAGGALALALQAATAVVAPLGALLHVVPLAPIDWGVVLGLAAVPAVVGEMIKLRRRPDR